MESASKLTTKKRVIKPTSKQVQSNVLEQEQQATRQPKSDGSLGNLPSGPGTRAMRQAAVIQMQQTHGNAHVMRQLDASIQRQEEEAAGPSAISSASSRVEAGGGGVEISGPTLKVHTGMTEVDGILKTGTLIADSVVSSSYTPGAGNIW
ncbi:MAG: hypothetical protein PVH65_04380 [Chloroflexota bacterium]|jgi:hypothetical protein